MLSHFSKNFSFKRLAGSAISGNSLPKAGASKVPPPRKSAGTQLTPAALNTSLGAALTAVEGELEKLGIRASTAASTAPVPAAPPVSSEQNRLRNAFLHAGKAPSACALAMQQMATLEKSIPLTDPAYHASRELLVSSLSRLMPDLPADLKKKAVKTLKRYVDLSPEQQHAEVANDPRKQGCVLTHDTRISMMENLMSASNGQEHNHFQSVSKAFVADKTTFPEAAGQILQNILDGLDPALSDAESIHSRNPDTIRANMAILATDPAPEKRAEAAGNIHTRPDVLDSLWNDPSEHVRQTLASNPKTLDTTLDAMHDDACATVRRRVACHPNTTTETLGKLGVDINWDIDVLKAVANNRKSPEETLIDLSKFRHAHVRANAASNPTTPLEVVVKHLRRDRSPKVRIALTKHPKATPELMNKLASNKDIEFVDVRVAVAESAVTSEDTLRNLADRAIEKTEKVWRAVANNVRTPDDLLDALTIDRPPSVRVNVAMNAGTAVPTLTRLYEDPDEFVRRAATRNPNRIRVAREATTPPSVLSIMASDTSAAVRLAVAQHPDTPPATLAKMASDPSLYVRAHVALHINTPPLQLIKLAGDKDQMVRKNAGMNPNKKVLMSKTVIYSALKVDRLQARLNKLVAAGS